MNNVCLVGNLARDPELRTVGQGISNCRFTLAVNRPQFNRNNDNQGDTQTADFVSCVAWRQAAENIAKYCTKGSQLGIVGRIQTGSYQKDGQTVYTTDVVVDNFRFLGGKNSNNNDIKDDNEFNGDIESLPTYDTDSSIDTTGTEINDDDLPF